MINQPDRPGASGAIESVKDYGQAHRAPVVGFEFPTGVAAPIVQKGAAVNAERTVLFIPKNAKAINKAVALVMPPPESADKSYDDQENQSEKDPGKNGEGHRFGEVFRNGTKQIINHTIRKPWYRHNIEFQLPERFCPYHQPK